jgi:phosphate:Na+ symporter
LLLPFAGTLEKLVTRLVPDAELPEIPEELDERLFSAPAIAMERCRSVAENMAVMAVEALKEGMSSLRGYSAELAASIREKEEKTDHYEDRLGTYLVKLSTRQIGSSDSEEAARLLKLIGDFERIADHAVNLLEAAEEMEQKEIAFTETAVSELNVLLSAVDEILDLSFQAFLHHDKEAALQVEPLEQVIDRLKEQLRTRHILRMQQGQCTMDAGFVWSDLLTGLERTADHCSNIAGCILDMDHHDMNFHGLLREIRNDSEEFRQSYKEYMGKYKLINEKS